MPGKIDALLDKKLENIKWGEYRLGDLFESFNGNFDLQKEHINNMGDYVITAGLTNNGIMGKTDVEARLFDEKTITVDMFGFAFYRNFKYKIVTHARVFVLKPRFDITQSQCLFLANSLHFINKKFGYENMCSWNKISSEVINLPTRNGEIDFEFMESFIEELEADRIGRLNEYLVSTGLNNYVLTVDEQQALENFENGKANWGEFSYKNIFNKIVQGRRLKKEDQTTGDIPFIMAGTTNMGVVNYISNPVASFPKNSITVDIFGNTFYRNYDYGAGDDTGVYWNNEKTFAKTSMLFLSTAISKSISGKFDYGTKLRSSQSLDFKMSLPILDNQPDYEFMERLISAVQKMVIKGVVEYVQAKSF